MPVPKDTSLVHRPHAAEPRPRYPRWHPHGWPLRVKIIGLLAIVFGVWGWTDVRLRGTIDPNEPGIHKTDFTVYTEAGAAFFDGRPPYEVTNPRGWLYLYPPPFAMLVAPLHSLPSRAQVLVWFALSVLMLYGCYSESVRIARVVMPDSPRNSVFGPVPIWIGWSALTATALPALNCLQRGQVGVAQLYLLLLGFRLAAESRTFARSFLGGCVLALPIVLKVAPLVPVCLFIFAQLVATWRAADWPARLRQTSALTGGVACGMVLCLFLLPAVVVGWRTNLHHLTTWRHTVAPQIGDSREDSLAGDSSSIRNQSLTNAVQRLGNWSHYYFAGGPDDKDPTLLWRQGQKYLMDAPLVGKSLLLARLTVGCLLVLVGYRVGRSRDALGLAALFGLACVSTLFLSPIARGHYYVLLSPAVLFTGAWLARQGHGRWALAAAMVPAGLSLTHYVLLEVAGRVGLLGIGTTLWYAAACIVLAVGSTAAPAGAAASRDRRADAPISKQALAA